MGTTKRIIYIVLITSLFGVAVFHIFRITKIEQPENELIYRGMVDDSTYQSIVRQETINAHPEQSPISLGEYIIAGFAAITAMMGAFKYFEEKRINELSGKIDTVIDVVTDRMNKDKVIKQIRDITKDRINDVDDHNIRILIHAIGERAEKFADETMVQDMTSDDFTIAEANIRNRCIETAAQIREMNIPQALKDAILTAEAANVINLEKELQTILDDRMRNHKYERYGRAVTDSLKAFLRDIAKADTKYNVT